MRKLRFLFTLLVVNMFAVQGAWARVAPTLPEAQALTSGQAYYLYNVEEGKFACWSSSGNVILGSYGDKVVITATGKEGEYTIQWNESHGSYWHGWDTYINFSMSNTDTRFFCIFETSKGYTIQRSSRNTSYYKADEFVGFDGSNGDRLSPALADGSIHWVLYTVDDAEYYMAKHKLFTYLEVADQYNFYITQYELVYEDPDATTAQIDQTQATLKNALDMSQNLVSPSWTEYPILFQNNTDNKWELGSNNKNLNFQTNYNYNTELTSTLSATVNVDNDATLCYSYSCNNGIMNMRVYLDGELFQIIKNNQSYNNARRYYIDLTPGKHDISWTCIYNPAGNGSYSHYATLSEIGIINTPTITPATTTVEGQLGTEVLKLIDPVSSVKKIVINGIIGADDWTTIGLMVNAFSIDMSGATATAPMPASMFKNAYGKWQFLCNVKLPQGLTAIGDYAFQNSDVESELTFPETLTSIGNSAFEKSKIKAAYMKDGITSIGRHAFEGCYYIENATYPAMANIPDYCFRECRNLRTFAIPEGVTEIGQYAFYNCSQFNPRFPSTISRINEFAFYGSATDELYINENVTVNQYAFAYCNNLTYAEWPTTFVYAYDSGSYGTSSSPVVSNCPKLNTVKLKSPTVVTYNRQNFFQGNTLGNITLIVPDFLVSAYKLDPYWYQCNVQGFSSADITDWNVKQALVLNAGQRIGGIPNLHFSGDAASFTVNGSDVQNIGDISINYSPRSYNYYVNGYGYNVAQQWGMMLGNTDKVNITGELSENVCTAENTWYFLTLPFDTKVGDITTAAVIDGQPTSYAIRYYDGAARANNGTGASWKNYTADDIIPAGTGFIYQTAKAATSKFVAQNNASKQYILSNKEFVKALEANPSDVTANKGWNLVGNPWQTYYNIHKLNFTAPITVWGQNKNSSTWTYQAYSIIDDDYAIKPLEAIFVQCPDEINSISFPIDGRQLTGVIESQNAARAMTASERKLIDVELTDGELTDKTRFVMNPQASMDYEITCDASKFMSMDANVPQIWTVEQGVQMAINERPLENGTVQIGFKVAQGGQYTISAPRNGFKNIVLVDNETGMESDLSNVDCYTFSTDAGTNESRFMLRVGSTIVNEIKTLNAEQSTINEYYNLNGQRVSQPQKGLYIVNGKKVLK